MTFESLALAGLSLGLSFNDILETRIGIVLGLVNEKCNQINSASDKKQDSDDGVVHGDANMLMNM